MNWIWDRKRPESTLQEIVPRTFAGPVTLNLTDGLVDSDLWSGRHNGIKYHSLQVVNNQDVLVWNPKIEKGSYGIGQKSYNVYSDYSLTTYVDPEVFTNGHWTVDLHDDVLWSTINAAIYRRENNKTETYIQFNYVDDFSGSGYEYKIREDNVLEFNTDVPLTVGALETGMSAAETRDAGEFQYYGNESGRLCFLKYFPVDSNSINVFVTQGALVTEWTLVDDFSETVETDTHYILDNDLGIITIGGYELPTLVLSANLGMADTTMYVYPDKDRFALYPESGLLLIGTELIRYQNKGLDYFSDLIRGALATTAVAHLAGVDVEWKPQGLVLDDSYEIYVSYNAIPRIEYEINNYHLRTCFNYDYLNVKPAVNYSDSAILQIRMDESHVNSLLLETNSPLMGGNIYGPLYFGTDISRLRVTALDIDGDPVADIPIEIEIIDGEGILDSTPQSITKISNSAGFIRANLIVPYSEDSISDKVTSVVHSGGNTEVTIDIKSSVSPEDVWCYEILKIDRTLGTVGMKTSINAVAATISPYGDQILTLNDLYTEDIKGGIVSIIGTDTILYQREIKHIFQTTYASMPVTAIYIENAISSILINGQDCWLLEPDAVAWDENLLIGTNVIIYEYDAGATSPLGGLGAWVPLHPDAVALNKITFNSRLLTQPDPTDLDTNLGGYMFVYPTQLKIRANAIDPATGNTIYSNTIRIYVDIPLILKGYSDGIPYGFSLISEVHNAGTGLGGANFITINPAATGINQLGMSLEVV